MKTSNSLVKRKSAIVADLDIPKIRGAVDEALRAVENARQKCEIAGQMLLEAKEVVGHGNFETWVQENLGCIPLRTARRWMAAATNIMNALPEPPALEIEAETISISEILTRPDEELPESAREWKQLWMDFTADKTIKECIAGVVVDGDPEHRMDRAINGKTKGGAGGDRKDFPLFVARKMAQVGTHLGHWEGMSEVQRTEVKAAIVAAINGQEHALRREGKATWFRGEGWPVEVCWVVLEAIRERVKGTKGTKGA